MMFSPDFYYTVLIVMTVLAVIVFISLHFVTAGYGMMRSGKWGVAISNRIGWILMEAPVFFAMLALWWCSSRATQVAPIVMASLFLLHYFQRSFVFPFLLKGKGKMPVSIVAMGITFNLINAYMLGGWIFYVSPEDTYPVSWLWSPQFIIGTVMFFFGMGVNIQSDHIVRSLRRPGDTRHYIPKGGMYRYVTSANYLGEFIEWTGFAILTWSWAGAVFALWTFANLAPRARSIHKRYLQEFGNEYVALHRKYILPFIY